MKNEMNLFTKNEFAAMYDELRKDAGLMKILSEMQMECGINERVAYDNADALIRMVAQYENLSDMLSQDAQKVLEDFLHESNQMSGYDRKVLLHQLSFGLKLHQDPELVEGLKTKSAQQLFSEYYAVHGEDPGITVEMLESEIYDLMGNYHISPDAMRMITKRMERTQDMLATSAALGEQGMRFKCVVAMDLYMRNRETMTIEETVTIACTDVTLEAAADAVAKGEVWEQRAKMIIAVAALAAIVMSIALGFAIPQVAKVAGNVLADPAWIAANSVVRPIADTAVGTAAAIVKSNLYMLRDILMFGGITGGLIGDRVAAWMGKLVAKGCYVRHIKDSKAVEALNGLSDNVEAEEKAEEKVIEPVKVEETVTETVKQAEKNTVFA